MPETRTYADRAEYIKQAVTKRRKLVRVMLLEYKGGKCTLCGYNKCANCHREVHNGVVQPPWVTKE